MDRREFLGRAVLAGLAGASAACRSLGEPSPASNATRVSGVPECGEIAPELESRAASAERALLPTPDFSPNQVRGFVAGIRPFRRGALRLERDSIAGRLLVHNYGHGGSGITLARGCALEVLDLVQEDITAPARIAVLGAGVNGLTVATLLAQVGYEVHVYADKFSRDTTSFVAGGQFAPSLVATGRSEDERALFDRLVRNSFIEYSQLMGRGFGVVPRTNYTTVNAGGGLRRLPLDLLPPVRTVERLPFSGGERSGYAFETLLIEPPLYLTRLQADLVAQGVVLEERSFNATDEIAALAADAFVNCLGLGAARLFADTNVVPLRGQLVHLAPQDLPYLLSHDGYVFPRSDAVVLGGTVERGVTDTQPDRARCESLLAMHAQFFGAPWRAESSS